MSANRLFQIINILLDKKIVTAKSLSAQFEVSMRTIYRDIDSLSMAGIPIYTIKGKGGGISLLDNYILDKSLLSAMEQEQILIALKTISAASADTGNLILKMKALFTKIPIDWLEVDLSPWGNKDVDKEKFNELKKAIMQKYIVGFSYINANGEKSIRKVKPAKLIFKGRAWYFQAFCIHKQDYRTFKINRISNIQRVNEYFTDKLIPPAMEDMSKVMQYPVLKLKFNKTVAYRVYDEFEQGNITFDNEENLLVSVEIPIDLWLYSYLLSFGSELEVLEPEYIKSALEEEIKKMYLKYYNMT